MTMTNKRPQEVSPNEVRGGDSGATRRSVLQAGALAAGGMALPGSLAARSRLAKPRGNTKVTVVLFQHGGADSLSLYAPTGDPNYASLRPTIAIPPPSGTAGTGLQMDSMFSMHPNMVGTHNAFRAQQSTCAVVQACGYSPFSRSHFQSQDYYERALAGLSGGGWINRHLQVTATPHDVPVRALALRESLPVSMQGPYPCYSVASTGELTYVGSSDTRLFLDRLAHGTAIQGMLPDQQAAYRAQRDTFSMLEMFSVLDPDNYAPANGANYPMNHIGMNLRQIAEVIKADLGVEFFTFMQHGWDHHSDQAMRLGELAMDLDQAVTAFFDDLGNLAQDVVLVTMSEFGRTVPENGSFGTDHGAGGSMMLRGGAVRGGQVYGAWPGLTPSALQVGDSLTPTTDFRDVLREVLEGHMGGTDPAVVFPGRVYQQVGVL